jgi:hypothetical protein
MCALEKVYHWHAEIDLHRKEDGRDSGRCFRCLQNRQCHWNFAATVATQTKRVARSWFPGVGVQGLEASGTGAREKLSGHGLLPIRPERSEQFSFGDGEVVLAR